jgi:hypothetical protein
LLKEFAARLQLAALYLFEPRESFCRRRDRQQLRFCQQFLSQTLLSNPSAFDDRRRPALGRLVEPAALEDETDEEIIGARQRECSGHSIFSDTGNDG